MAAGQTGRPSERVGRLRAELRTLQVRYDGVPEPPQLDKLERAMHHRRRQQRRLLEQIAELKGDLDCIAAELSGYERAVEAVLAVAVDRIRTERGEAWSPDHVLGYRYWMIAADGMRGFRNVWTEPRLEAECPTTGSPDDVPHSDGRCGRLGCGVYAAKSLELLEDELAELPVAGFAVGVVGLSGKVVEHELGYRGASAEVLALTAVSGPRVLSTDDGKMIAEVFADPSTSIDLFGTEVEPSDRIPYIKRYLVHQVDVRPPRDRR